jgi:hypothetical protein
MGGEQAARTMQIVTEAALALKGKGIEPDPSASAKRSLTRLFNVFESASGCVLYQWLDAGRRRDRSA